MDSGDQTPSRTATPAGANGNGVKRTKICVYCGSSRGTDPAYMQAARDLAKAMAEHDIDLVYGGGTVGLMGEVARTLVSLKGPESVHGIIPEALVSYERDTTYTSKPDGDGLPVPDEKLYGVTTVVKDMHTRKSMMAREVLAGGPGSGFIALPGGFGTIEELVEMCTWNQLGIHDKGIVALNIKGYYEPIRQFVAHSVDAGFIRTGQGEILTFAATPDEAIRTLRDYKVSGSCWQRCVMAHGAHGCAKTLAVVAPVSAVVLRDVVQYPPMSVGTSRRFSSQ
ncbi:hypothetical protein RB595_001591 [Gaeumannomyces hyphopodioides]